MMNRCLCVWNKASLSHSIHTHRRHVVRWGVFFWTTVCKRMHSSLHSNAALLKNYSKSIVKILRRFLFSYLPSDLASLFEFSWFLCPLVLTMGIVPGRGCHDFQRHPFSAPQEGIFFMECSAKGFILDKRCLLNISWMLLGSSSIMWPAGEGFVKVPGQKGRNLESDASESSFSFFLSCLFLAEKMADSADFLIFLSKLFWYQCLLLILTGCFWWSKNGAQTASETPKKSWFWEWMGVKTTAHFGMAQVYCELSVYVWWTSVSRWGSQRTAVVCETLTFTASTAFMLSFKTTVFLSKLTLISQTVTHGVLLQGCVWTSCFCQTFQYFQARLFV